MMLVQNTVHLYEDLRLLFYCHYWWFGCIAMGTAIVYQETNDYCYKVEQLNSLHINVKHRFA